MESALIDRQPLPLLFWLCAILIGALGLNATIHYRKPWGMPSLVVLGTLFIWYLGDILYTGIDSIAASFPEHIINHSLWQVMLFAVVYQCIVLEMSKWFTRDGKEKGPPDNSVLIESEAAQNDIERSFRLVAALWAALLFVALYRSGFPLLATFLPPLAGHRVDLWSRARLGGSMDFLVSAGSYTHVFFTALFGVALALGQRLRTRISSALMVALSWPYFLFGGIRSTMLAIGVPCLFGYALFSRHRPVVKLTAILSLFLMAHVWFRFVVATRNAGVVETLVAISSGRESGEFLRTQRHLGLDMFKELCYMNDFIEKERYSITWGGGYFAEAVNLVPRGLWPSKPMIGMNYAKARGAVTRGWGNELVNVTFSTGMVGQGVGNFGGWFGPTAAAVLMSIWTGLLAKLWSQRQSVLRLSLYLVGLGLTFNAGRDITLLVFFPFVFGYVLIRIYEHVQTRQGPPLPPPPPPEPVPGGRAIHHSTAV